MIGDGLGQFVPIGDSLRAAGYGDDETEIDDVEVGESPDLDDDSDADATAAETHTGAMIALVPSDADLLRLELPGGEPAEELHLTLYYLGEASQYPENVNIRQQVVECVMQVALEQAPLAATGFGVAVWNPTGASPALVLNVGGEGLEAAHDEIGEMLEELWSVTIPEQHEPWQPHICLAYAPDPAPLAADALLRVGPLVFDKIRVAFGENVTDIPLGYASTTTMSLNTGVRAMEEDDTQTVTLDTSSEAATGDPGAIGNTNLPGTVPAVPPSFASEAAWEGILVVEGVPTGDGRQFAPGSLTWATPPLPLQWAEQQLGEHMGAVITGRIDEVWRDPANSAIIRGRGVFDTGSTAGAEAFRMVGDQFLNGVSVDVDSVKDSDVEFVFPPSDEGDASELADDPIAMLFGEAPELMIFHAGRIRGATQVALPAFVEAQIQLVSGSDMMDAPKASGTGKGPDSMMAAGGQYAMIVNQRVPHHNAAGQLDIGAAALQVGRLLTDAKLGLDMAQRRAAYEHLSAHLREHGLTPQPFDIGAFSDELKALVAGANVITDAPAPPIEWFTDPQFTEPTPFTVTNDGHVFGHAALWGTCHSGFQDACVTPPREGDQVYYRLGDVITAEGIHVAVGHITMGTGHANMYGLTAQQAMEHYDNTGTVVADVASGEDRYGIWVAGAIRPGVSAAKIAELRAAKLSGDWRRLGGRLRLIAMLAVNVPGFAVPRLGTRMAQGKQLALVASGILPDSVLPLDKQHDKQALESVKQRLARRIGRDVVSRAAELRARVHKGG